MGAQSWSLLFKARGNGPNVRANAYSTMTQSTERYELEPADLRRASLFLQQCKKQFKASSFVKTFDVLDILLFIYRRNELEHQKVYFSTLQEYVSKSDVYLSKVLKHGVEDDYLVSRISDTDRRLREYGLSKNSIRFIESLRKF